MARFDRNAHCLRTELLGRRGDAADGVGDLLLRALYFDDKQRLDVERIAGMDEFLDCRDGRVRRGDGSELVCVNPIQRRATTRQLGSLRVGLSRHRQS